MFQAPAVSRGTEALPLYRDAAVDYKTGLTRWSGGRPVVVHGLEAVKSWAWRAVNTARYLFPALSWDYGNELTSLVGHPYRAESKLSEAARYVEECLLASPYILEARTTETTLEGSSLRLRVRFRSVYGEEELYV